MERQKGKALRLGPGAGTLYGYAVGACGQGVTRLLSTEGIHLTDPPAVVAGGVELGVEKCLEHFPGVVGGGKPGTKANDVRIVVLAQQGGHFGVPCEAGPDAAEFVGRHYHAFPASAHQDAGCGFSLLNGFGYLLGIVGIVDRFLGKTPNVLKGVPGIVKAIFEKLFEDEAGVVGAQVNGEHKGNGIGYGFKFQH